ncbi:hypothetical protein LXL04_020054 [Taraxacum kok-saghyz]
MIDSACSLHMTGRLDYLRDFKPHYKKTAIQQRKIFVAKKTDVQKLTLNIKLTTSWLRTDVQKQYHNSQC